MVMEKIKDQYYRIHSFFRKSVMCRRILYFLKFFVAFAILFFIFRRIELRDTIYHFSKLNFGLIFIILLSSLLKILLQIINWFNLVNLDPKFRPKLQEVISSYFVGIALRFLVPGGHAVFGKMYFIENRKKATFVSVGLEKFVQTIAICWSASLAAIFFYSEIPGEIFLLIFGMLTFLPLFLYLLSKRSKYRIIKEFRRGYIRKIFKLFFYQILFILITIIQYYIIIKFFEPINFLISLKTVPIILLANIIPITFSGLGFRESFSIYFFSKSGIDPISSLTTSLTIFIFNSILPALVGTVFILKKKKQSYKND